MPPRLETSKTVSAFVKAAAEDAYARLIAPAAERELRNDLTGRASEGAIQNFSLNLKPLLLQPPVKGAVTMGLDPGYRNGCKVAVVDPTGRVLDTAVVYLTGSQKKQEEAGRASFPSFKPTGCGTLPLATALPPGRRRR